jgi:anti-sigma28 factor (negative regulator of flagellin synthesis)
VTDPDKKGQEEAGAISDEGDAARAQRIRSIKEEIQSGAYRVDPGAVAARIVDDAVEKIRSRSRLH